MKQLTVPDTKFVISFDESLNKSLQLEQMDIFVRLWDCNINRVQTRYFNSQFLGHTRASDIVSNFKTGIGSLNYSNLLQILMDGPATNWKLFDWSHVDYMLCMVALNPGHLHQDGRLTTC
jgi:hypothetical protein